MSSMNQSIKCIKSIKSSKNSRVHYGRYSAKFLTALTVTLLLALFLTSCTNVLYTPPLLAQCYIKAPISPQIQEQFGAYYIEKSTFIGLSDSKKEVRSIEAGALRIVSQKGMRYTSIPFENAPENLLSWQIMVTDSTGNILSTDHEVLRAEFDRSGVLVFGTVPLGSTIRYELVFSSDTPLQSSEVAVASPLFVQRYSVIFGSTSPLVTSSFDREKGSLIAPLWIVDTTSLKGDPYYTYQWNALPYSPTKGNTPHYVRGSQLLSSQREALLQSVVDPLYSAHDALGSDVFETIGLGSTSIDEIYQWVRDSISLITTPHEPIHLSSVLANRQGNTGEKTGVLQELLGSSGVKSDIYLTRRTSLGGLDPTLLVAQMLTDPFVVVEDTLALFPFDYRFNAGSYPVDYWKSEAFSLASSSVVKLPPSSSEETILHTTTDLFLGENSLETGVTTTYEGYHGMLLLAELSRGSGDSPLRIIGNIAKEKSPSNTLDKTTVNRGNVALTEK